MEKNFFLKSKCFLTVELIYLKVINSQGDNNFKMMILKMMFLK